MVLLLLPMSLTGCADASDADDAADKPIEVTAQPLYTVGEEESDHGEMFARVRSIAFDASDKLYVLDSRSYRVVVFDSAGEYVREFGKRGEGPGELSSPTNIFITPDGRIAVSDSRSHAIVLFDSLGQHLYNVTLQTSLLPLPGASHSDGHAGAYALTNADRRPEGLTSDVVRFELRPDPVVTPLHSLHFPDPLRFKTDFGTVMRDPLWSPDAFIAVLPDGRAVVHHDTEYTLLFMDSAGRVDTITRPIPAKIVTEEDKRTWKAAEDTRRADAGITMPLPYEMPFAERMAVVSGLRSDPKRGVWVQRRRPDGEAEGPIDVMGARGEYLGTLPEQPLPDALSASGRAAWIVEDFLGVERVAVKRLLLQGIDD
jgi:hypothetical protein